MKIQDLLRTAIERLPGDTPQLDAQVLLAHVIGKSRAWIMAHPEFEMDDEQQDQFNDALRKLEAGEPLPYVLGKWEFFGLEFEVTKDVLIPRPETELLVEKAIVALQKKSDKKIIADIGVGSGAIAVSIAVNVPDAQILATDISSAALQVAKRNAQKFNVQDQIEFVECDLLPEKSKVKGQRADLRPLTFDLICANLPYIPTETMRGLSVFGREPTLALDGGRDGLELFRRLFQLAPKCGVMLLEIESSLGAQTINLAANFFPDAKINLYQDLAGKDRLVEIVFP
ncbi:MAG: peptide chain release factor N(5)-glutamine methyltransferase [Anaerolineales bacterium]|nr:peptide chain release factor N(5)-glutamine methyltransferase [Anaerolineales bacterium]